MEEHSLLDKLLIPFVRNRTSQGIATGIFIGVTEGLIHGCNDYPAQPYATSCLCSGFSFGRLAEKELRKEEIDAKDVSDAFKTPAAGLFAYGLAYAAGKFLKR